MSLFYGVGSPATDLTEDEIRAAIREAFACFGVRERVIAVPPDFTRFHPRAGLLTKLAWEYFGESLADVLPALGTHTPMTETQIATMFGGVPPGLFRRHDWRNDIVTLGEVPGTFVAQVSEGKLDYAWPRK